MMDLRGLIDADAVTRVIPNLMRSGGGRDLSWLPELYRVMRRDARARDVDLMHANLGFVFHATDTLHEPCGVFVEIPEAADFPEALCQTSLILEWEFLAWDRLTLGPYPGRAQAGLHWEWVPGGVRLLEVRPARLLYVESMEAFEALGGSTALLHFDTERKSVWSLL